MVVQGNKENLLSIFRQIHLVITAIKLLHGCLQIDSIIEALLAVAQLVIMVVVPWVNQLIMCRRLHHATVAIKTSVHLLAQALITQAYRQAHVPLVITAAKLKVKPVITFQQALLVTVATVLPVGRPQL
jgi:hypothetical protein